MAPTTENKFKILIADENIQYRNSLATCLRVQGYSVEFATGGFHLLHTLEQFTQQSLIILHQNMFDMPAEEIILMVRTTKNKSELPIIYISKNKIEEEIIDFILKGANEYIVKSPSYQPILDCVKKFYILSHNS